MVQDLIYDKRQTGLTHAVWILLATALLGAHAAGLTVYGSVQLAGVAFIGAALVHLVSSWRRWRAGDAHVLSIEAHFQGVRAMSDFVSSVAHVQIIAYFVISLGKAVFVGLPLFSEGGADDLAAFISDMDPVAGLYLTAYTVAFLGGALIVATYLTATLNLVTHMTTRLVGLGAARPRFRTLRFLGGLVLATLGCVSFMIVLGDLAQALILSDLTIFDALSGQS